MPTILHSHPMPGGQQVLVVETRPPAICRRYEPRRLDIVLTNSGRYTRINGRSVIRRLMRETFVDVRSEAARAFYEHTIGTFTRAAENFAVEMTENPRLSLPDAPADAYKLILDDIKAMGLARRSAS
ncbi:hypothetical protein [Azospirillum melinis]